MAQQQYQGVGMAGSKSYRESSAPGTPGIITQPTPGKGADPEGFGWKALDYAFSDRPLYHVAKGLLKNKAEGKGFCGNKQQAQGGMTTPPPGRSAASNAAAAADLFSNYDAAQNTLPASTAADQDYGGYV